jgi:hypothetical protein
MVELLTPQVPLEILHSKIFKPIVNPVMFDVANVGLAIVPLPDNTDQVPKPTVGALPLRVVLGELTHNVWFVPATDIEGMPST